MKKEYPFEIVWVKSIPSILAQVMKSQSPILHFSNNGTGGKTRASSRWAAVLPVPGIQHLAGAPQVPGCPRVSEHTAQKVFGVM